MKDLTIVSMSHAVSEIKSGDRLWIGGATGISYEFVTTLEELSENIKDVEIVGGMVLNPKQQFMTPAYKGTFYYTSLFLGPLERAMRSLGNMSLNTTHYSCMKDLFKAMQVNVAVLEVSPPDEKGFCSLGPIGGVGNRDFAQMAEKVILVINENVPHCGGGRNCIHVDKATTITSSKAPLITLPSDSVSDLDIQIGNVVADLVDDGCTLQIGIGSISNAVGYALKNKNHIKIHTEMLTSSMVELIQAGAVDPSANVICTLAMGDQNLVDYLKSAKNLIINPCYEVTDPYLVSKHDNFVSVNTCIAVDLTGQVTAEGMGYRQISATGGAYDFARAARMSEGGKSIIALKSAYQNKNGELVSNIMPGFPVGTPITYLRSDVDYIVTEYGVAHLMNKSYEERVERLLNIAHPELREGLREEAKKHGLIH